MKHDRDDHSLLDYPGYCLTLSLVFVGTLGLSALLHLL
jgi:hypothetical protein